MKAIRRNLNLWLSVGSILLSVLGIVGWYLLF